jgi:hypothetical protein
MCKNLTTISPFKKINFEYIVVNRQQAELLCQMGIPNDQTGYHVSAGERIDSCKKK